MTGDRPISEDDLHALVDGVLPAERRAFVEAYLAANPGASARILADREQRTSLRERLAFKANEPVPSRLRIANLAAERRRRWGKRLRSIAAAVVLFIAGGVLGWSAHEWSGGSATRSDQAGRLPVFSDAIAAHRTFVVEVVHPVEVAASQEQHLVQWLSKRLGRPLQVPDLKDQGFKLMGGRLLPASTGPAAQFMFENASGTRMTLYVSAQESGETAFRFAREGEVSAFYWVADGFGYAISGGVEREQLLTIADAVYRQLEKGAPDQKRTTL
jgi:anti-sigma factor RsiW